MNNNISYLDENMLEVDFDNAERDGKNLDAPCWQLLANDSSYRARYVSALLAESRRLRQDLADIAAHDRSCQMAALNSILAEIDQPF